MVEESGLSQCVIANLQCQPVRSWSAYGLGISSALIKIGALGQDVAAEGSSSLGTGLMLTARHRTVLTRRRGWRETGSAHPRKRNPGSPPLSKRYLGIPDVIRYKTDPKLAEQSATPPQPAELTPDAGQGPLRRDAECQMAVDIQEGPEEPAIKAPKARRQPKDAR